MTLENYIAQHALAIPDKVAVVCGTDSITYAQLWKQIMARAHQLKEQGVMPHRPYVFKASQTIDFIISYCAVHHAGAIAVPLEQGVTDTFPDFPCILT